MQTFLKFTCVISWLLALCFSVYLWIFDWGLIYLFFSLLLAVVHWFITPFIKQIIPQATKTLVLSVQLALLLILLLSQTIALWQLSQYKHAHDTGESWSQYGAL